MGDSELTEEQWRAKAIELFGDDETAWTFVCPQCSLEMSIQGLRKELTPTEVGLLRAQKHDISQGCIGRAVPGRGCDWAAYGLFSGPVFVKRSSGQVTPIFDFAGKPFTGGRHG